VALARPASRDFYAKRPSGDCQFLRLCVVRGIAENAKRSEPLRLIGIICSRFLLARRMHRAMTMQQKAWELQERTRRFVAAVARFSTRISSGNGTSKAMRTLLATSTAMHSGYRDVCSSSSPEKFIAGISAVARNAKKAKTALVLLVQLDQVSIETARELILEARGLEAIFHASRNTAKKRARGRMVSRRNPSERAAHASDGKTPRKRQNPPGVT
jgi:hypothetical protein